MIGQERNGSVVRHSSIEIFLSMKKNLAVCKIARKTPVEKDKLQQWE